MAKSKNSSKVPFPPAKAPVAPASPKVQSHALRETVESIVIAFVLAFLFRTFEAEAFVIPTGSMAPTLMGRHKDVNCPKCGYRYQVGASEEEPSEDRDQLPSKIIAGECPICRYVMPMGPDIAGAPMPGQARVPVQSSYNGDRILVNKYLYTMRDPERWDVVVFKYPGDAKMNYIKRLVGLPGETLKIYQGDIFIGPTGAKNDEDFKIERKPADKVLAMRQLVHDTEHDPAELDAAGWPLRWHVPPGDAAAWKLDKNAEGSRVRQRYSVDAPTDKTAWLRYENLQPTNDDWQQATLPNAGQTKPFANLDRSQRRRLITDSNPYNARIDQGIPHFNGLQVPAQRLGLHWVGDLMVEADVQVQTAGGELILDLVEGGKHFDCTIDLKTGEAKLSAGGLANFAPIAKTKVIGPGKYHVAFANVDDQLLLWVDGRLVSFEGDTGYDATKVFGDRRGIRPQTSDADLGDLAPVGIGARGAKLDVTRLQVWRDIYYIADSWERNSGSVVTDFHPFDPSLLELPTNPSMWNRFGERNEAIFPIGEEQLFVMGDNSAESSDARLWARGTQRQTNIGWYRAVPGGAYLDKRLLIGKALSVYWPHSWNRIPGTPIPFPLFPNVIDMRLVR